MFFAVVLFAASAYAQEEKPTESRHLRWSLEYSPHLSGGVRHYVEEQYPSIDKFYDIRAKVSHSVFIKHESQTASKFKFITGLGFMNTGYILKPSGSHRTAELMIYDEIIHNSHLISLAFGTKYYASPDYFIQADRVSISY